MTCCVMSKFETNRTAKRKLSTSRSCIYLSLIFIFGYSFVVIQIKMHSNPGIQTQFASVADIRQLNNIQSTEKNSMKIILELDPMDSNDRKDTSRFENVSRVALGAENRAISQSGIPGTVDVSGRTPTITSSHLHVFYYAWYGSPTVDGKWLHWDHQVIRALCSPHNSRTLLPRKFEVDIIYLRFFRIGLPQLMPCTQI